MSQHARGFAIHSWSKILAGVQGAGNEAPSRPLETKRVVSYGALLPKGSLKWQLPR
jgi:hypothetical protein